MQDKEKRIRVLVVDDSAVMRRMISTLLERDEGIEVIATAIDGDFALSKVEQLKPDVVTLDVDMPRMDGMTALGHLVSRHSVPVVMLSSLTSRGAELTMRALEKGAADFVCKPKVSAQIGDMADELIGKIKAAAGGNIPRQAAYRRVPPAFKRRADESRRRASQRILAIGASSGGPHALRFLLPKLPADLDASIVVVQHLPESFTGMLARWLDEICEFEVREASDGDLILPGRALIAPANAHMKVKRTAFGSEVMLVASAPVNGHVPSVDVLFESVAEQFGADATGLLMTGMGCDGAEGLGRMKRAGGHTVAQDRESCSVFGMPRAAIDRGHVDRVVSLDEMAAYILGWIGRAREEVVAYADYGRRV
jgi:two-component system chemotaxis response regulator CheB